MGRDWSRWDWIKMIFFAGPITIACAFFALAVLLSILQMFIDPPQHARHNARRAACQSNLKHVALAMQMYTEDHAGYWPPVALHSSSISAARPLGWADALEPYLKSVEQFQCPSEESPVGKTPREAGYTDYFLNERLAGKKRVWLTQPTFIILLGDGNDGTDASNARYSLSTLPAGWRRNENSPAFRHLGGANYAFADGHVKWYKPEAIKEVRPNGKTPTFAVR